MRALHIILFGFCFSVATLAQTIPSAAAIDAKVNKIMTDTHAKGMALASSITAKSDTSMPTASAMPTVIR